MKPPTRGGSTLPKDPRWISVQMNLRMPWWYRAQLETEAEALHTTTNAFILDALERIVKPKPPTE